MKCGKRNVLCTFWGPRILDLFLEEKERDSKREIRGLTAMAMDAREASAGPLLLQGDHGPIEFYKIVVTPLVR